MRASSSGSFESETSGMGEVEASSGLVGEVSTDWGIGVAGIDGTGVNATLGGSSARFVALLVRGMREMEEGPVGVTDKVWD